MIIISPKNLKGLKCRDPVTLQCECCGKHFAQPKNQVLTVIKKKKRTKLKYCSRKCQFQMQKTSLTVECKQCNKQFEKSLSRIEKTKNNFCSKSCSATWNNKHSNRSFGPKKTKSYYCKVCNVSIKHGYTYCKTHKLNILHNYCLTCNTNIKPNNKHDANHETIYIPIEDKTIAEVENLSNRRTNRFQAIRAHSRKTAKKAMLLNSCAICGYSKHVVACHIKEISSYNKHTLIGEVNKLSNLIGLCKNHHWEMDHGLLSDKDKIKLNHNRLPYDF